MWKLASKIQEQEEERKREEEASQQSTVTNQRTSSAELQKKRSEAQTKSQGKIDLAPRPGPQRKKKDPTEIRLTSEVADLDPDATPGVVVSWPNMKDLLNFEVTVEPQEGLYRKAKFKFNVVVPKGYPHSPPTVTCETRVYHPNIDLNGRVCLNILRSEWNPCLGISHVLMGLMTLFLEPNPDDPLNHEAADLMVQNVAQFRENVVKSLRGAYLCGHQFPKLLD
eukprot:TRINITY_DN82_c0_g1_i1.p1 TRINITY_DN82_c0_g1~~TRINITY_DN82_c0_g1_i1.p1  ORF type:complete len:224 (-),score=42.76 TRINITY_DN82_c0_g1_i1:109-780(-)